MITEGKAVKFGRGFSFVVPRIYTLIIPTMMHSRYLVLLLLLSCSGKGYVEVLKFSGEGYEIRVLSSDGEIKVGINEIRVEVNPPAKVEEFYLYMPAMSGMPEMREY